MRLKLAILTVMLMSLLSPALMLSPVTVYAASGANCVGADNPAGSPSLLGFPTWYKYLDPTFNEDTQECELSFNIPDDVGKILLAIFEIILRVVGLAAVGFIIYGGFQYLVSQGEPERTKGAKSTILNAVIGLAIALSATVIVNLIGRNIF